MNVLETILDRLLGIPRGFLQQQGDWSLQFNPVWPGQSLIGTAAWNISVGGAILALVIYIYRRDTRSGVLRVALGTIRFLLLVLILALLNRPMLALIQSRVEPSVLAVMLDDSLSMRVTDADTSADPLSRLSAAKGLLSDHNGKLLQTLAKRHNVRVYRFDRDASLVAEIPSSPLDAGNAGHCSAAVDRINTIKADGSSTQVLPSVLTMASDLQGQRTAGIVVMTDGRDSPATNITGDLDKLKSYGVKVYPVVIGSDRQPRNIQVQSVQLDDVAFKDDVVNVKAMVRATGYEANHSVKLVLKDHKTGAILNGPDGKPAETTLHFPDDRPIQAELQWQASEVGRKDLEVEAIKQPGELDETDNSRTTMISVLDAKISVLFVDGYPRWDYRYLKNMMLRDKSISVSCLLASAGFDFIQEGNKALPVSSSDPVGHFPETLEELLQYDVLVIGDVDPHFFSDHQMQLMNEFARRGGGFMMVAGPRWTPQAYHDTSIEALLPITLAHVDSTDPSGNISSGFRPVVTDEGAAAGIFRFFADKQINLDFLQHQIPELFWYCRGITAKPSVGEVLAEHPSNLGPDGHKAPLLVAGRYGGRTLFSAVDDSWRWRFYTDEHVFDSFWVHQLRYLARNRKIGQRRLTLNCDQPSYEPGQQVHVTLRVLDPVLISQLSDRLRVKLIDSSGKLVQLETLVRQGSTGDEIFSGAFSADSSGQFTVQLPSVATGVDAMESSFVVSIPNTELVDARVDRLQMSRLASETSGKMLDFGDAAKQLEAIPSAEVTLPLTTRQPLWAAPLTFVVFMLLICTEWIVRKLNGMV